MTTIKIQDNEINAKCSGEKINTTSECSKLADMVIPITTQFYFILSDAVNHVGFTTAHGDS